MVNIKSLSSNNWFFLVEWCLFLLYQVSGGSRGMCKGRTPRRNFFIFVQFPWGIGQIVGWCPLRDWYTLWEVLDPPLQEITHLIL